MRRARGYDGATAVLSIAVALLCKLTAAMLMSVYLQRILLYYAPLPLFRACLRFIFAPLSWLPPPWGSQRPNQSRGARNLRSTGLLISLHRTCCGTGMLQVLSSMARRYSTHWHQLFGMRPPMSAMGSSAWRRRRPLSERELLHCASTSVARMSGRAKIAKLSATLCYHQRTGTVSCACRCAPCSRTRRCKS